MLQIPTEGYGYHRGTVHSTQVKNGHNNIAKAFTNLGLIVCLDGHSGCVNIFIKNETHLKNLVDAPLSKRMKKVLCTNNLPLPPPLAEICLSYFIKNGKSFFSKTADMPDHTQFDEEYSLRKCVIL